MYDALQLSTGQAILGNMSVGTKGGNMPVKPGSIKLREVTGKGFCVVDATSGNPINGGKGSCHPDRPTALRQLRAIYATSTSKTFSELDSVVQLKNFADAVAEAPAGEPVWIEAFPYGHWPHPKYTDTTITQDRAERLVKNFKENVRGIDIATDYEHGADAAKGQKASGWIKDAAVRDTGVWVAVDFTPTARQEIANGEWKYFSGTMFDAWVNDETGEVFEDVIVGGGLTNKPYMKNRVPLNFSEVITSVDEDVELDSGLRFKMEGDKFLVSEDGGVTYREAVKDEVVEWEHSEPGTGPTPRTDEDDRSGDLDNGGIRRDSPPPAFEDTKEGSEVKLTKEALKALGLSEDASEDQVSEAIEKMYSELEPLKVAEAKREQEKTFAELFPEEHKELEAARMGRLDNAAKSFSENFNRIRIGEGDEAKKSTRGPSALALDKIAETHKQFSAGNVEEGMKAFSESLEVILSDKGIVDYGEGGSSREVKDDDTPDGKDAGKQFAEKITEIQNEAGGQSKMSWGDALSEATKKFPELAKAYSESRS